MTPIRVFISYAGKNKRIAEQTCDFLEKQGKVCWIAPRDITAGSDYGEAIINGIEQSDVFVLIFTEASNRSQHVLREVERAVSKKLPILAFRLDDTAPSKSFEYFLLTNQWLDASKKPKEMLTELNRGIERIANSEDLVSEAPEAVLPKRRFTEKHSITIALSIIAVGVIAIALVLAWKLNDSKSNKDGTNPTISVQPTSEAMLPTLQDALLVGKYLRFGTYRPAGYTEDTGDGSIVWEVVDVDSEQNTAFLVSRDILDIKPFDCAESGLFDKALDGQYYDRNIKDTYSDEQIHEFRGSNDWKSSDLHAWLNAVGTVTYEGLPPKDDGTDDHGNGFATQLGFLSDFSERERALLTDKGTYAATVDAEISGDMVFLLSVEEIEYYTQKGSLRLRSKPTNAAINSDETSWYILYKNNGALDYLYATRTASEEDACRIIIVNSEIKEERYDSTYAGASGLGIRPAIRISLTEDTLTGDGSETTPYQLAK